MVVGEGETDERLAGICREEPHYVSFSKFLAELSIAERHILLTQDERFHISTMLLKVLSSEPQNVPKRGLGRRS